MQGRSYDVVGYLIITLLQSVPVNKRVIKIGQYLAKTWTKVCWHVFMVQGVYNVLFVISPGSREL